MNVWDRVLVILQNDLKVRTLYMFGPPRLSMCDIHYTRAVSFFSAASSFHFYASLSLMERKKFINVGIISQFTIQCSTYYKCTGEGINNSTKWFKGSKYSTHLPSKATYVWYTLYESWELFLSSIFHFYASLSWMDRKEFINVGIFGIRFRSAHDNDVGDETVPRASRIAYIHTYSLSGRMFDPRPEFECEWTRQYSFVCISRGAKNEDSVLFPSHWINV